MSNDSKFPTPLNFPYDKVFYYDGESAMIFGTYKRSPHKSLGLRWTIAESTLGYPNIFGRGMWMVVPTKLALYLLRGIENEKTKKKKHIIDETIYAAALKDIEEQDKQAESEES